MGLDIEAAHDRDRLFAAIGRSYCKSNNTQPTSVAWPL